MPRKQKSNVDAWLELETPRARKVLESASRHFDTDDNLTVNTLEAVYGRESSFGTLLGTRGSSKPAGHFQFEPPTAKRYGPNVSKENVEDVFLYEAEFAIKSPADKNKKQKKPGKKQAWCTEGRWRTIDDRPVFICA